MVCCSMSMVTTTSYSHFSSQGSYYGHTHAWTNFEIELLWFCKWDHANDKTQPVIEVQEYFSWDHFKSRDLVVSRDLL